MTTTISVWCCGPDCLQMLRACCELSSDAPWPETGGQRDQESRIGLLVFEPDVAQRNGERGIEVEAIPSGARAGPDRAQLARAVVHEQLVLIVDAGMVEEGIALDSDRLGRAWIGASGADLGLDADTAVAEQGAGIVAAPDGVIAGRKFL